MNRDTQFQAFAKLLFEELQAIEVKGLKKSWNNLDVYRRQREAIARRAYDFACHIVRLQAQGIDLCFAADPKWIRGRVELMSDMTELPSGSQFDQEYLGKFVE